MSKILWKEYPTDSINYSFLENELKKFSYMPSPDHKYLIELSVTLNDHYPELDDLNIVYLSKSLKNKFSFIENISLYKYDTDSGKVQRVFKNGEVSNTELVFVKDNNLITTAIETSKAQEQNIKSNGCNYSVKYIPYYLEDSDIKMNWWKNYIIEIVYMLSYTMHKNQEITYTDHLTKIANRKKFEEFMADKLITLSKKDSMMAVFFFDLNSFKDINDTYGHNIGDSVLQAVALRLKHNMPKKGIISRLGGDEFIGAIPDLKNTEDIISLSKQMAGIFKEDFLIDNITLRVRSSIGVSIAPNHGSHIEELIFKADTAMYHAKQNKLDYFIYTKDLKTKE